MDAAPGGGVGSGFGPGALAGASPWSWEVSGQLLAWLAVQAAVYGTAVLLVETGTLHRLWRRVRASLHGVGRVRADGYQPLPGQDSAAPDTAAATAAAAEGGDGEDVDVAAERRAVQSGQLDAASVPVLLRGVSKTYWQRGSSGSTQAHRDHQPAAAGGRPAEQQAASGVVHAVQDLWLAIGRPQQAQQQRGAIGGGIGGGGADGECFGLLGVNGAGKTTTWRIVTGAGWESSGPASAQSWFYLMAAIANLAAPGDAYV